MKSKFVKDLKLNDEISEVFAIQSVGGIQTYKSKPGYWFPLEISDQTGSFPAKFWGIHEKGDDTNSLLSQIKIGDVVLIRGKVENWEHDYVSIKPGCIEIKKIGEYDPSDFIATTKRNIPDMVTELKQNVANVGNTEIKRLLESYTNDDEFIKEYSKAPAAKKYHHNVLGGLLEHVLNLIHISKKVAELHPELDLDLLIAGCILHDIGKIREFETTTVISITDEGRLLEHISIGHAMVSKRISELDNFPKDIAIKILHIILSHHDMLEKGSPVRPYFPEAKAFSKIDDCDAQIRHIIQLKEENKSDKSWVWPKLNDDEPLYLK